MLCFFFLIKEEYDMRHIINVQEETCYISHYQEKKKTWDNSRNVNRIKWQPWTLIHCYHVGKASFPLYLVTQAMWQVGKLFVVTSPFTVVLYWVLYAHRINSSLNQVKRWVIPGSDSCSSNLQSASRHIQVAWQDPGIICVRVTSYTKQNPP